METVASSSYEEYFEELAEAALLQHIRVQEYSKVFVLVDGNTRKFCLDKLQTLLGPKIDGHTEIVPGEAHKTIKTCSSVWQELSSSGGDRKSVLINLGGGVVTDLGGFVASTFKRGIDFINIPTTLLAMVDASIGGKTGVDLGSLKNQIGVINQPEMVLIFPDFLKTLEERQITSGFAEMLKHGLIKDSEYWESLKSGVDHTHTDSIQKSIAIKNEIVLQDPTELGIRKILNFGHTLGHAIESYFLDHPEKPALLHGEAIAIGMILEAYLSHKLKGLSKLSLDDIKTTFLRHFERVIFSEDDLKIIIDLMKHDKKNAHGNINFVLLQDIGQAVIDVKVPESHIESAFAYYNE